MPEQGWQGFLMPELPAEQPWKRRLYCTRFEPWEGTLTSCQAKKMILAPKAHHNRRWAAGYQMTIARTAPTGAPSLPSRSLMATTERDRRGQAKQNPRQGGGTGTDRRQRA